MILILHDIKTNFKSIIVHVWNKHKLYTQPPYIMANEPFVIGVYTNHHTIGHCFVSTFQSNLTLPIMDKCKTGEITLSIQNFKPCVYPKPVVPNIIPCNIPMTLPYLSYTNTYINPIGISLPSGAYLLHTGKHHASLQTLTLTLNCLGMSENDFMVLNDRSLYAVSKALTLNATQTFSYVPDVQYLRNKWKPTDRWETSRTFGDCEDCSKEIYIQIQEWLRCTQKHPLIQQMQYYLSLYVPVLVQTCIESYKNHIVAALIPKRTFYNAIGIPNQHKPMPTLLLEGTVPTNPFYHTPNPYKYAIACMTPELPNTLDYLYGKLTIGIPFDTWWKGNYNMIKAQQFTTKQMNQIKNITEFEKHVSTMPYLPKLIQQHGIKLDSYNRIGYKTKDINNIPYQNYNVLKHPNYYYIDVSL